MKVVEHSKHLYSGVRQKLAKWPWKRIGLWSAISVGALLLLAQIFYPQDRMALFSKVDGIDVSWQTKNDAINTLNDAYKSYPVEIYMTGDEKPVTSPKLSELNVSVDNAPRIEKRDYPWYLRIVPTSLFWAGQLKIDAPQVAFGEKFQTYIDEKLMPSCQQAPINASLKVEGEKVALSPEADGRLCEKDDLVSNIKAIQPLLTQSTEVHVGAVREKASVSNEEATVVVERINKQLATGVSLDVKGSVVEVPTSDIVSWLDFTPHDDTVDVTVSVERAGKWLESNVAGKVSVKPGTSFVTTRDFTEISRKNGASGQALDTPATVASLQKVINSEQSQAVASTIVLPPNEQYERQYSPSDQGLSALMANYAKDHPGTFGVSMIELDGKKRRADFDGDKQFVTASTYKLLVAYSLLKQIDAGARSWDTDSGCFNKMISLSDNPCSESFLNSLGLMNVTKDVQAIGLKNSTFAKAGGPYTTANDMSLLLGMIATGQNFSGTNQQRLIAAMKGNVYRKGIPAGVQGTVADKVGFLNGLLHDAAIVYGPNGTYVLAIMTDGSSWATIADLAKQIDNLRTQ